MVKRSQSALGVSLCLAVGLGCMPNPTDGVALEGPRIPLDGRSFVGVYDPATGELSLSFAQRGAALQTLPEGSGPDQVQLRVLAVETNAACGFADSFCLDAEIVSYYAADQLTDTRALLTSLSSNSSVLNSDLGGLGGWRYGDIAPGDSCAPAPPAVRRWVFDASSGERVSFAGEIQAVVELPTASGCEGGTCDTCNACACSQDCTGQASCDSTCTDGATCAVSISGTNNGSAECVDSTCDISCSNANTCGVECTGDSACTTRCSSLNNCSTLCTGTSSCDNTCSSANGCTYTCLDQSTCRTACNDFNGCSTVCTDASVCEHSCNDGKNCRLDCQDDAECLLDCGGRLNRCALACPGGATDCGSGIYVCNRPCP